MVFTIFQITGLFKGDIFRPWA